MGGNGGEMMYDGTQSARKMWENEWCRDATTRLSPDFVERREAFNAYHRSFLANKRQELGRATPPKKRSKILKPGEYLIPMSTTKSVVKRLPPDQILRKLQTIPEEQRNLITPTLDAMLAEAKIILPPNDSIGSIARVIEGKELVLLVCRNAAHESKPLLRFIHAWEILHEVPLPYSTAVENEWRQPTWEEVCHYADVEIGEFLGAFMTAAHNYGVRQARVVLDFSLSRVVAAAAENAIEGGSKGFQDRQLLLQAGGLVATGGTTVNVNQQTLNVTPGANQGLPSWNDSRKLLEAINDDDFVDADEELTEEDIIDRLADEEEHYAMELVDRGE